MVLDLKGTRLVLAFITATADRKTPETYLGVYTICQYYHHSVLERFSFLCCMTCHFHGQ